MSSEDGNDRLGACATGSRAALGLRSAARGRRERAGSFSSFWGRAGPGPLHSDLGYGDRHVRSRGAVPTLELESHAWGSPPG